MSPQKKVLSGLLRPGNNLGTPFAPGPLRIQFSPTFGAPTAVQNVVELGPWSCSHGNSSAFFSKGLPVDTSPANRHRTFLANQNILNVKGVAQSANAR